MLMTLKKGSEFTTLVYAQGGNTGLLQLVTLVYTNMKIQPTAFPYPVLRMDVFVMTSSVHKKYLPATGTLVLESNKKPKH